MALFIGSNLKTNNWGEDFVIQKCIEYFDDSCIIYRNREVFGTQFDICILLPNQGIVYHKTLGSGSLIALEVNFFDKSNIGHTMKC